MSEIHCPRCHRPTRDAPACDQCGAATRLDGRWVLEEMVGHGASGYTWRARKVGGEAIVAIKELSFRRMTDLKELELFEREGEALAAIEHPGVPRLIEQFVVEDDRFVSAYLVQEFIDGGTISLDERTDEAEVKRFLLAVADILETLHDRRPPVIHRDIKPSNVMRRKDGSFVLIDFGVIRAAAQASMGGSTVAGTLGYMAPEQLLGKAEPASDFYGLGATAVAMLAGRDASEVVDPHAPGAWRRKVEVSEPFAEVLEKLVATRPSRRISNASELREALAETSKPTGSPSSFPAKWLASFRARRDEAAAARSDAKEQAQTKKTQTKKANAGGSRASREDRNPAFGPPTILHASIAVVSAAAAVAISIGLFPEWIDFAAAYAPRIGLFQWSSVVMTVGLPAFAAALITGAVAQASLPRTFQGGSIWVLIAVVAPVAAVATTVSLFLEEDAALGHHWFGERDGELRMTTLVPSGFFDRVEGDDGSDLYACSLVVESVPEQETVTVVAAATSRSGCQSPEITENGSVWLLSDSNDYVLYDLWSGELLYDSAGDVEAETKFDSYAGEKVRLEFPDGTTGEFGIERPAPVDRMGRFVSTDHWVYQADLPSQPGFRKQVFTRDSGCGALEHLNAASFGEGEWKLAQVAPERPRWTRSIEELTGHSDIEGVMVGPGFCWLVTRADSELAFHDLDVDAGTAELVMTR